MSDVAYIGGDNSLASSGNYSTTQSAAPKVLRQLTCEAVVIDGITVGNRAWAALRGHGDTPQDREEFKRHCAECLKPLVDSGLIADLVIVVDDDPLYVGTVAASVTFRDVPADSRTTITLPPWGA
jgi:hypothetical protein